MRTICRLSAPLLVTALAVGGCSDAGDTGEDDVLGDTLPADGKLDSFRSPTLHGRLYYGTSMEAALTSDARYHAWTFEPQSTSWSLRTSPGKDGAATDTVLYLYEWDASPPGGWRLIDKSDNTGGTVFSAIEGSESSLGYRVIVKGKKKSTRGAFTLSLDCEGEDCPEGNECAFSEHLMESVNEPGQALVYANWLKTISADSEVADITRRQIVKAVGQHLYHDEDGIDTLAEALDAVGPVQLGSFTDSWSGNDYFVIFWSEVSRDPELVIDGELVQGAIFRPGQTTTAGYYVDGYVNHCKALIEP
jgi:hypothetical protein